jgi:uncharacterized protein DUF4265
MTDPNKVAVHNQPVWRGRSDFIINAELAEEGRFEQLFVRQLGENRFEVCCIPFFAYDIALGDVVLTVPKDDCKYMVDRVVEPSGRYVLRVWFGDSSYPRDEVSDTVQELGSVIEWSSRNLLAIDAVDAEHAQRVADFLAECEEAGKLVYETGRS